MKFLFLSSILSIMVGHAKAQIIEYCKSSGLAQNQICIHAAAGSDRPYDCSNTYMIARKLAFKEAFKFCKGNSKLLGDRWKVNTCSTPKMNGRPVDGSGTHLYGIFQCI